MNSETPRLNHDAIHKGRRWAWFIPLAALIVIAPLIVHGCSCGHDFDFHLLNWIEVANQLRHGILHPDWAYTPAYNAGEPRFVFYPPLTWYLGALLGLLGHFLGMGEVSVWNAAPIVFTWFALTVAGLAMYRLARAYAAPNVALLAAAFYMANPYMLFTAYERTAYAELLAAAWMPLLFLAALRPRVSVLQIALPLALLWLTNAPAAVMGSYTLAFLILARIVDAARRENSSQQQAQQPLQPAGEIAFKAAAGTALGLALAAFYILPAAYERRYILIRMAIVSGLQIQDNFLFEHTTGPDSPAHDVVLHTASVLACIVLAATALALAASFFLRSSGSQRFTRRTLAVLGMGIGFLLLPPSVLLWHYVPEAEFLQFPWRLLAVLAVVLSLLFAMSLARSRLSFIATAVAAFGLVAVLVIPAYRVYAQRCYPEDTPATAITLYNSQAGTIATDEYTPVGADNDVLKPGNAPYWLADSPHADSPANATPGPAPTHLSITTDHPQYLVLNLRDYPVWSITRNGVATEYVHRPDGLVAVSMPMGKSTIEIHHRRLADRTIGEAISVTALGASLILLRRRRRPEG